VRPLASAHRKMTDADLIWNRAATIDLHGAAQRGDRALWALLQVHGLTMNGGVLHAVEVLSAEALSAAGDGYRFFGLASVADLLERARQIFEAGEDLENHESRLDTEYSRLIPDDSALCERFEEHFRLHPYDFAPL
jgi:hypothetical protein